MKQIEKSLDKLMIVECCRKLRQVGTIQKQLKEAELNASTNKTSNLWSVEEKLVWGILLFFLFSDTFGLLDRCDPKL